MSRLFASCLRIAGLSVMAMGMTIIGSSSSASAHVYHFSRPGVRDTGTLPPGDTLEFTGGSVDGVNVTVHCTTLDVSGIVPTSGLTITLSPPTVAGCTDNLGGTVAVMTNRTHGNWKLKVDSSGSTMTVRIPEGGMVFTDSLAHGCVITTHSGSLVGSYNDLDEASFTNAGPVGVGPRGCDVAGTTVLSANVAFSEAESVAG